MLVMGRREGYRMEKTKKLDSDEENVRTPLKSKSTFVFSDSDDDAEANEDLSLKIVEKAMSRVSADFESSKKRRIKKEKKKVVGEDIVTTEFESSKKRIKKEKKKVDGENIVMTDFESSKKRIKKEKKKVKNMEIEAQAVDAVPEGQNTETIELTEGLEVAKDDVDNSDNAVLRRLLRGPRYFDVSENSSWGMCYNCGEDGHMAVNCKSAKRKKPCFVCGSFEHGAKECQKGKDCFICNKSGHRAKDCPKKYKKCSQRSDLCLKCGSSGHAMSSCNNNYSLDDLKEIQCYVCKSFGHLCCANYFGTVTSEVSCYKCGQLGHTGLACRGGRGEMGGGERTPSSCFKCGEEGHFARECSNSVKVYGHGEMGGEHTPSSCYRCGEDGHFARECSNSVKVYGHGEAGGERTPSSCYKCGEDGHFSRECSSSVKVKKKRNNENSYKGYNSASQGAGSNPKKKKLQFDEENNGSSSRWKPWNRCMTDNAEYFPRGNGAENWGWESYSTPNGKGYNNYSRNPERSTSTARSPKRFDSPYTKSRFGNPNSVERKRNYDRW